MNLKIPDLSLSLSSARFLCHIYGDLFGSNYEVRYLLFETMNNVNNKKDEMILEF